MDKKLFIPGPVDVSPDVFKAMSKSMIGHRGREFSILLEECVLNLKKLMYTRNNVFISPSSSTGLMEAAIRNCVGDRCLNIGNGAFSDRWHDITTANGKEADLLQFEWGEAPSPGLIDEKLSTGEYDALTLVHNETSTGVTAPIYDIAEVVRDYDVSFLVDAVSSMGGIKLEVDKLGIDVCLFGVQKAMALPAGLAVCSVSDRALKKAESLDNRGYYFDFLIYLKYWARRQTPTTGAISLIQGLRYQLDKILNKEGLENRFNRHREMGELTRKWAKKNFSLLPEEKYASNTVSCIKNTAGIDCSDLGLKLTEKNYVFSTGYGKLKDKTFRIAHMGDRTLSELQVYLETIDEILGG
ncbi:MAG: alanine--glyoxylate aminotransferase family protein [Candidatus Altiarchaeota archaeon]|nr:alanine--glyoxylate aminotransferase family protein [Candidatus Altiarchaeota archaeon]